MGRPKGQRDATPRTRRTKAELNPVGALRIDKNERALRRRVKDIMRDLMINDWYIKIGLAVSGIQLAVAFTYLTGSWWAIILSAVSATGKAAFVEGGVWLINRTISHARAVRVHWSYQAGMWAVLMVLMWVSVRANVAYEWEKKAAVKYPKGECVLIDEEICVKYEKITVNGRNVDRFLTSDEQLDAWQRGGLIPLLVFASILIGRIMLSSKDGYEREETKRLRESERGVERREREKKAKRQKVDAAESVGLEVAS